jgi:hypothetical protein
MQLPGTMVAGLSGPIHSSGTVAASIGSRGLVWHGVEPFGQQFGLWGLLVG